MSLSVAATRTLIEKMASNQGWREKRANNKPRGVHHIDGFDMLAAKMDLLLKKLEGAPEAVPVQALDSRITCEHCGNTGHTGTAAPKMDRRTSTSSTTMASVMGLVLNQVGIRDPTYLSLVKVRLLVVLISLTKILSIKKL